jgi:hypothetical protein
MIFFRKAARKVAQSLPALPELHKPKEWISLTEEQRVALSAGPDVKESRPDPVDAIASEGGRIIPFQSRRETREEFETRKIDLRSIGGTRGFPII